MEYNKLLRKLRLCYPDIEITGATSGQGTKSITAICSITDNMSLNGSGKYICEDSYYSNPRIVDLAKMSALKEALAHAGIDLDSKDIRCMTKSTIFRPTKQYPSRVSWKRNL